MTSPHLPVPLLPSFSPPSTFTLAVSAAAGSGVAIHHPPLLFYRYSTRHPSIPTPESMPHRISHMASRTWHIASWVLHPSSSAASEDIIMLMLIMFPHATIPSNPGWG
ncbi:hypothetical protein EX30DRAFT_340471 [Ascodesmis nigricans]|uniref:Uncharacterized protein n=1 Tax=Ascodesmis nigricans TaxID=341454 RepID=A0A4S2MXY6_9PEZI|nr:hypothetical protein EX30DRAFT_340471 [Ascodesmis nigricans]